MGTPRDTTDRQLARLQAALDQHTTKLKASGKSEADFENDAKYRHLRGDVSQVRARLVKLDSIDALNAEVARLKAEREGGEG